MKNTTAGCIIEIISSGTEILQGLYPDTNTQWLSAQLDAAGYAVRYHHAATDNRDDLAALLRRALQEANLVLMTGGLGPTADDLTRQAVGEVTGREMILDQDALERIRERFRRSGRQMPESNQVQAELPRGAAILHNDWGTAPGFILELAIAGGRQAALIALPGPPREMRPMFATAVLPWLLARFPLETIQARRVLNVFGQPESAIDEKIGSLYQQNEAVYIGLRAQQGQISIRINAHAPDDAQAQALLDQYEVQIRRRLDERDIFAVGEVALEEAVAELLRKTGNRVACAESCTGGMISTLLTRLPGSSQFFCEAFVTYSNEAKIRQLGVAAETLNRHGAVSAETAREMAAGARSRSGADYAISVTGISGPDGGTAEKPVGLTWFGIADRDGVTAVKATFAGDRSWNRELAATKALDLLRRKILGFI